MEILLDEAKPAALVIEADDPSLELLTVDLEKLWLDLAEFAVDKIVDERQVLHIAVEETSKLDLDVLEPLDTVELVVSSA